MQSLETIIESNLDLERLQAKSPNGGQLVFKMAAAPNISLKITRAFAPKMNAKNPKRISSAMLPQLRKDESEKEELELDSIKPPGARVYEIILRQMKSMH